jgi:hypothetical protein
VGFVERMGSRQKFILGHMLNLQRENYLIYIKNIRLTMLMQCMV